MKKEEPSYEDIQKALALKRHEQPPAPFFNRFSDEVLNKLHEPRPAEPLNWCQRLGLGEDPKPILLCLLGLIVCGALGIGLIAALRVEKPPETLAIEAGDPTPFIRPVAADGTAGSSLPGFESLEGQEGLTVPVVTPMIDGISSDQGGPITETPVSPED